MNPLRTFLLITAMLGGSPALFGQGSDIKAIATTLEQQVNSALNAGDLVTAWRRALDLVNALSTEMHSQAPGPQQTLVTLETAYAAAKGDAQFFKLMNLPGAAFSAGDLNKARQYAQALLAASDHNKKLFSYADAIFEADTILGRVALRDGDVATAKELLLASVSVGNYTWLGTLGPEMGLAQELLARGEKDTVIQFLTICKTFWKSDNGNADLWIAAIKGGGTPVLKPRRDN